ncbi:MAG: hypothetical protein K2X03_23510 [Bryobacteraceae bacterium]|nr:hypothetical protein [Bryobacteraceae bacterium]
MHYPSSQHLEKLKTVLYFATSGALLFLGVYWFLAGYEARDTEVRSTGSKISQPASSHSGADPYAQYRFDDKKIDEPMPARQPDLWYLATSCKSFVDPMTLPTDGTVAWQLPQYLPNQQVWAYKTIEDFENGSDALYKLGTVTTGQYKNYEVLLLTSVHSGLSAIVGKEYFLRKGSMFIALAEPPDETYAQAPKANEGITLEYDPSIILKDLRGQSSLQLSVNAESLPLVVATSSGAFNLFS